MKKKETVRMLLLFLSFIIFVPFSFFTYYGNTALYMKAYCDGVYNDFPLVLLFTIITGLGLSLIVQLLLIFFLPDNKDEKRNRLLRISISDSACVFHVATYIISLVFLLLLRFGLASLPIMIAVYLLLLVCEALTVFLPGQKDAYTVSNRSEKSSDEKALDGFIIYLGKLSSKCESPAMRDALDELVTTLKTIDPSLSHGMQALETELSAKCVSIEDAISKNDGTKITVLTRELHDTSDRLEKKISAAIITLKGDDFSRRDNEIAEGLIDEILDAYEIEEEKDIVKIGVELFDDLRFIKAKRFADTSYRELLEGYEKEIIEFTQKKDDDEKQKNKKFEKFFSRSIYAGYSAAAIFIAVCFIITAFITRPGGFSFSENDDGTLALIGYNPLYGSSVSIPKTVGSKAVTSISTNAIRGDGRIVEIIIPDGVKRIEYEALRSLPSLTAIYLPESIEYIANYAFYNDDNLVIYYAGSKSDFEKIEIGSTGNDFLYLNKDQKIFSDDVIKFAKQSTETD